jgi:hypothetical protein
MAVAGTLRTSAQELRAFATELEARRVREQFLHFAKVLEALSANMIEVAQELRQATQ